MDSRAIFRIGHGILYGDFIMDPTSYAGCMSFSLARL